MAGRKKAVVQTSVELPKQDFDKAKRLYLRDIKPHGEKVGEHSQSMGEAYREIKDVCHVNTRAARFVFKLSEESEEKRNDILRSVRGLLAAFGLGITDDLVSSAEGEKQEDNPVIPTAEGEQLGLVTVQ